MDILSKCLLLNYFHFEGGVNIYQLAFTMQKTMQKRSLKQHLLFLMIL